MSKPLTASGDRPSCRVFFFFQAEDGIRDVAVTGVQTCALPISNLAVGGAGGEVREAHVAPEAEGLVRVRGAVPGAVDHAVAVAVVRGEARRQEIGRASCRERV